MEYAPHILIAATFLGCLLYVRRKIRKGRRNRNSRPRTRRPASFKTRNDLVCVMHADGTTTPGFTEKRGS